MSNYDSLNRLVLLLMLLDLKSNFYSRRSRYFLTYEAAIAVVSAQYSYEARLLKR